MRILITSGTGTIATQIKSKLLESGHTPVLMSHSPEKLKNQGPGIEAVYGDFDKPESWKNALTGIDKVCLITPAMEEEGEKGVAFAKTAYEMGVQQIAFLGIHNVMSAPEIPHFKSKILIKSKLHEWEKPFTVIEANNFYQNDLWFIPWAKETKFYLQPIGSIGLNRVDARDIAEAMVNSLLDKKHYFQSYPLIGPEALTGEKISAILSSNLGVEVTYPEDCFSRWEAKMKNAIPDWLLEDWRMMYTHFTKNGLRASPVDLIMQEKILGHAPRKYEDYVKEFVALTSLK